MMHADEFLLTTYNHCLYIECTIGLCYVERVLIDDGSAVNFFYYDVLINLYYIDDDI